MKPAKIYQQYIWIVNTLRQYKKLSLEELNTLWMKDQVIEGRPLVRQTFAKHKDAILNMFGIIIECDLEDKYRYYIANPNVLENDSLECWMLSTLTVNTVLSESSSLRDRILLEDVPAGEEFLQTIIQGLKTKRRLHIVYQKFGCESGEKLVAPLALKLFHQRWYMLSHTGNHFATYSLDRMQEMKLMDETFEVPEDFSPEDYFAEYFGVTTDGTPLAHVVIRAYGKTPNYIRTLPLHSSQKEIQSTEEYTDFSYDIRPTYDFINELCSYHKGLEVLEPQDFREKIRDYLVETLSRY